MYPLPVSQGLSNTGQSAISSTGQGNYAQGGFATTAVAPFVFRSETDPTKVGSASDRIANLHRSEWQDYLTRFQPRDRQLLNLASGTLDNEQAIARSREAAGTGFDVAEQSLQRDMSRLGLSQSADEVAQRGRSNSMARAAAEVSAVNGARLHTQDRDLKLMSGDMATGLRSSRLGEG